MSGYFLKLLKIFFLIPCFLRNTFFRKEYVVLFSGGMSGNSFLIARKALKRGYRIILISDRQSVLERLISSKFIPIDYLDYDIELVLNALSRYSVKGVLTGNGEQYLPVSVELAERLGLPALNLCAALASRDKSYLSSLLSFEHNKKTFSFETELDQIKQFQSECVVKPVDGAGNDGVRLFQNGEAAYAQWLQLQADGRHYLFEEFIAGDQFDVEGVSVEGQHTPFAVTLERFLPYGAEKVSTYWFLFEPEINEELHSELYSYAEDFLNQVGVTNGAWHIELRRRVDGTLCWVDFGNRFGGTFEETLELTTGFPFLDNYINIMTGQELVPSKTEKQNLFRIYPQSLDEYNIITEFVDRSDVLKCREVPPVGNSYGELEIEGVTKQSLFDVLKHLYSQPNSFDKTLIYSEEIYGYK